jgi:hypothetical protein
LPFEPARFGPVRDPEDRLPRDAHDPDDSPPRTPGADTRRFGHGPPRLDSAGAVGRRRLDGFGDAPWPDDRPPPADDDTSPLPPDVGV